MSYLELYGEFLYGDGAFYGADKDVIPPSPPTDLYVIRERNSTFNIVKWEAPTTLVTGTPTTPTRYVVYRSEHTSHTDAIVVADIVDVDPSGNVRTCFIDETIDPLKTYFYQVMCYNEMFVGSAFTDWEVDIFLPKDPVYDQTRAYTSHKKNYFYVLLEDIPATLGGGVVDVEANVLPYKFVKKWNPATSQYDIWDNRYLFISRFDTLAAGTELCLYVDNVLKTSNYVLSDKFIYFVVDEELPHSQNIKVEIKNSAGNIVYQTLYYKTYNYLDFIAAEAALLTDERVNLATIENNLYRDEVTYSQIYNNFGYFFGIPTQKWQSSSQYRDMIVGNQKIELITIPSTAPYEHTVERIPALGSVRVSSFTAVSSIGDVALNKYYVNYTTGKITFHESNAGQRVVVFFYPTLATESPGLYSSSLQGGSYTGIKHAIKSVTGNEPSIATYRDCKGWIVRECQCPAYVDLFDLTNDPYPQKTLRVSSLYCSNLGANTTLDVVAGTGSPTPFDLCIYYNGCLYECFTNLNMCYGDPNYVETRVNGCSAYVTVSNLNSTNLDPCPATCCGVSLSQAHSGSCIYIVEQCTCLVNPETCPAIIYSDLYKAFTLRLYVYSVLRCAVGETLVSTNDIDYLDGTNIIGTVSITDIYGNFYSEGVDFSLDAVSGKITWCSGFGPGVGVKIYADYSFALYDLVRKAGDTTKQAQYRIEYWYVDSGFGIAPFGISFFGI